MVHEQLNYYKISYLSSQWMMTILFEIWGNVPEDKHWLLLSYYQQISHEVKDVAISSAEGDLKRLQGQGTAVEGKTSETSFTSMFCDR